jgi:hypothetical protein
MCTYIHTCFESPGVGHINPGARGVVVEPYTLAPHVELMWGTTILVRVVSRSRPLSSPLAPPCRAQVWGTTILVRVVSRSRPLSSPLAPTSSSGVGHNNPGARGVVVEAVVEPQGPQQHATVDALVVLGPQPRPEVAVPVDMNGTFILNAN